LAGMNISRPAGCRSACELLPRAPLRTKKKGYTKAHQRSFVFVVVSVLLSRLQRIIRFKNSLHHNSLDCRTLSKVRSVGAYFIIIYTSSVRSTAKKNNKYIKYSSSTSGGLLTLPLK